MHLQHTSLVARVFILVYAHKFPILTLLVFILPSNTNIAHLSASLHTSFSSSTEYKSFGLAIIRPTVHLICIYALTSHGRAVWWPYRLFCSISDIKGLIQLLFTSVLTVVYAKYSLTLFVGSSPALISLSESTVLEIHCSLELFGKGPCVYSSTVYKAFRLPAFFI